MPLIVKAGRRTSGTSTDKVPGTGRWPPRISSAAPDENPAECRCNSFQYVASRRRARRVESPSWRGYKPSDQQSVMTCRAAPIGRLRYETIPSFPHGFVHGGRGVFRALTLDLSTRNPAIRGENERRVRLSTRTETNRTNGGTERVPERKFRAPVNHNQKKEYEPIGTYGY